MGPAGSERERALDPGRSGAVSRPVRAARMRSGVAGKSCIQAPVASAMAATTAGAATSMGSSPTPFAPCGAPANGASTRIDVDARRVERGRDEVRRQAVVQVAAVDAA